MGAKFKVGDKVRVIKDIPDGSLAKDRKDYLDKVVTIYSIQSVPPHTPENQWYQIVEDHCVSKWPEWMLEPISDKPEDSSKPATDSFIPIKCSGNVIDGSVGFTKDSRTLTYKLGRNYCGHFWNEITDYKNNIILEWLGLEDLANEIAILATSTEHPNYRRGFWPYSTNKEDNDAVMQYVILLVQRYNEFKSKDKLREDITKLLAKSSTKASPEPDLTADSNLGNCLYSTLSPDLIAAAIGSAESGEVNTIVTGPGPYNYISATDVNWKDVFNLKALSPTDKEVKLSIDKRKSYKVKSR